MQLFGGFSLTTLNPCARNTIVVHRVRAIFNKEIFARGDSDVGDCMMLMLFFYVERTIIFDTTAQAPQIQSLQVHYVRVLT